MEASHVFVVDEMMNKKDAHAYEGKAPALKGVETLGHQTQRRRSLGHCASEISRTQKDKSCMTLT